MTTKAEIELANARTRAANLAKRAREESSQLQQKAVMFLTAGSLGYIMGQEQATNQMSSLRAGGFTPPQVVGAVAAVAEMWADDKDTKQLAGGIANGALSVVAFQLGQERGNVPSR